MKCEIIIISNYSILYSLGRERLKELYKMNFQEAKNKKITITIIMTFFLSKLVVK